MQISHTFLRPPLRRIMGPVCLPCLLFAMQGAFGPNLPRAFAQDVVVIASSTSSGGTRVPGTIVDYTGQQIAIQTAGGREQQFPAERVLRIETTWTPEQTSGDEAFAAEKYDQALAYYERAMTTEQRTWARRGILAQIVWCHRALGNLDRAGAMFLLIVRSDPATQYYDAMPLAWLPRQPSLPAERQAQAWLAEEQRLPAAALLGASWLLTTGQRAEAIAALQRLAGQAEARVALLAQAQLWRTQVVTASAEDVARWQQALPRFPEPLRAGPYFLVGQALARRGDPQQAALALLRVPILYPKETQLAAEALLAAGEPVEKISQLREAAGLYQEILDRHPQSAAAEVARDRLAKLAAGRK